MILDEKVIARFWAKVQVRSADECWDWIAAKNSSGYGSLGVEKKTYAAHRISYQLANGDIPDGLQVLHRCDRPCCVNPDHLWLGTQADNMEDMTKKQRHGSAKLTENDVKEIYRLSKEGLLDKDLAVQFEVSPSCVTMILNGKNWSHLREKPAKRDHFMRRMSDKKPNGEKNGASKLTEDKVRQIRQLKESSGLSNRVIGEMFGVSPSRISFICTRKSWSHVQ